MRFVAPLVGILFVASIVVSARAEAQTARASDAVAVCETQRAVFKEIRDQNRQQMAAQVTRGVLVGVLAGAVAGGVAANGQSNTAQRNTMIAGAVIGGLAGGVDQYLSAKRQITQNNRELARLIEADATGHASKMNGLTASIRDTGRCRQEQITTWQQRLDATRGEFAQREAARASALAAAADDRARREIERDNRRQAQGDMRIMEQMSKERDMIAAAIEDDRKLQEDVLKYYETDIRAMAEAQARVEATSTASLRGPAEGYTVAVVPPAILAGQNVNMGSTASAFGSSGSAFGGGVRSTPAPTAVASAPGVEPWEARIDRPAIRPNNGHQAALVAHKDASAESVAATQSGLARLQMVYGMSNAAPPASGGG